MSVHLITVQWLPHSVKFISLIIILARSGLTQTHTLPLTHTKHTHHHNRNKQTQKGKIDMTIHVPSDTNIDCPLDTSLTASSKLSPSQNNKTKKTSSWLINTKNAHFCFRCSLLSRGFHCWSFFGKRLWSGCFRRRFCYDWTFRSCR